MKVLDIILEQAGDPLDMLTATANISRTSGTEIQVKRIQELLAKHKKDGQPFFDGPPTGKWDSNLDNSIIQWKEWINEQVGRRVLNTGNSSINQQAVRYLRAKVTNDGRLDMPGLRTDPQQTTNPFQGQTFKFEIAEPNPIFTNDRTTNMRIMVSSIGLSGWIALLHAARTDELERVSPQAARRMARTVITGLSSRFDSPPAWKNNLENMLRTVRNDNKFVEINGQKYYLAYPHSAAGQDAPQKIFEYYKTLCTYLLSADLERNVEYDREVDQTIETRGTLLKDIELDTIANQIHDAFEFSLFTGGTDEADLETIFQSFTRPGDYDGVASAFAKLYPNEDPLNEQLDSELDDNEYDTIVTRNLIRIGKITPQSLFYAIKFGEATSLDVTYDNVGYNIPNEINGYDIDITTSTGKDVRDVILQDSILKQAIEDTGGTLPSEITVNMQDEHGSRARATFEQMLQENIPEMVAFYTRAKPFNEAPPLGIARAKAIMSELYRFSFGGADQVKMDEYARTEINKDRSFLLDDVLVYFDPKYRDESTSEEGFKEFGDVDENNDEEIETNSEHEETATKFTSEEEERIDEATREILNADDPIDYYNKVRVAAIRLGFTNRRRESIDLIHDPDADSLKALLSGEQLTDNPMFKLIPNIPLHIVARNQAAIVLDDAMGGDWDTTDEDSLRRIFSMLEDKEQYEIVARAYQRLFAKNLAARVRREDANVYREIYQKFGLDEPGNMTAVETPFGKYKFMEPNANERIQTTLPAGHSLIAKVKRGFGSLPFEEDEDVTAFVGYDYTVGWTLSEFNDTRGAFDRPDNIEEWAKNSEKSDAIEFISELKSFLDAIGWDFDEGGPIE